MSVQFLVIKLLEKSLSATMWILLALAAFLHFDQGLAAEPLTPVNCTLPPSSPLHFSDDCKLLCRPAKWTDILIFYLGNYAAHAATTKLFPGASVYSSTFSIIAALLFPSSGIFRGAIAISSGAIFANTELQTAAKAGAIYAVERFRPGSQKRPRWQLGTIYAIGSSSQDDVSRGDISPSHLVPPTIHKRYLVMNVTSRKIHGRISLLKGWYLAPVNSNTKFDNDEPGSSGILEFLKAPFRRPDPRRIRPANSYSAVKSIIAIIQVCFSITTLYRSRGTQIDQFGYAAFGLTVAPYAFMSIVNLIGNLVCPEYPAVFIVENIELDNMRVRIAAAGKQAEFFVESTVGRIAKESDQSIVDDLEDIGEAAAERRSSLDQLDTIREAEDISDTHAVHDGRAREISEVRKTEVKVSNQDSDLDRVAFSIPVFGRSYPIKKSVLRRLQEFIVLVLAGPIVICLVAAVPISIVGGLSEFKQGQSTHAQRIWTMTWLAFGSLVGAGFMLDTSIDLNFQERERDVESGSNIPFLLLMAVFYGAPAVGGFIVVGQMIIQ